METILYFFRDEISGTHYFIYAFICFLFLFAIIGYLFKQKYGKVEFKLGTNQQVAPQSKKDLKKAGKEAKKKGKNKGVTPVSQVNATNTVPVNNRQPQVAQVPQTNQSQSVQQPQPTQAGGLQQPTSLPNLNQTAPAPQTSAPQASDGIPEIIE